MTKLDFTARIAGMGPTPKKVSSADMPPGLHPNTVFWFDDFLGDNQKSEYGNTIVGGSIAVETTAPDGIIKLVNTTVNSDVVILNLGTNAGARNFSVAKRTILEARVKVVNPGTYGYQCFGFGTAASLLNPANDSCRFQVEQTGSFYWQTKTNVGASLTTNTTAITATDWHTLKIELVSASSVKFYIDDILQFEHTTNISTALLLWAIAVINSGGTPAAAPEMHMDWLRLYHER